MNIIYQICIVYLVGILGCIVFYPQLAKLAYSVAGNDWTLRRSIIAWPITLGLAILGALFLLIEKMNKESNK